MNREVFVDSGAWIALSDIRDKYHDQAKSQHRILAETRVDLVTTNLVIGEVYAVIRRTGGYEPAIRFLRSIRESIRLRKIYSDPDTDNRAEDMLRKYKDQDFSLVDAVSFVVMEDREIEQAFAFDEHFRIAGFQLLP